jgi:hypothetical protein
MVARALFALSLLATAGCRQILGIEDLAPSSGGDGAGADASGDGASGDGASGDAPAGTDAAPLVDGPPGDAFVCTGPWTTVGSECYRASNPTSVLSWAGARDECVNLGGRLAITTNDGEHNALVGFVMAEGATDVWIGLSDVASEGTWIWVDGTLAGSAVYWAAGQPNGGTTEDCARLHVDGAGIGTWFDDACTSSWRYVCQRP